MSHIPQPTPGEGEQIPSVQTTPPAMDIQMPASQAQDIMHVGENMTFDQWNVTQFRFMTSFEWSTMEPAGKILWYTPLSPQYLDKNLAYYSKLFNAWTGDFVFQFKIAGTGFHAGLISFAKLPPNIHPSKINNPGDFSVLPWVGCDPKMLEVTVLGAQDIRNILFHYNNPPEQTPPVDSIGGYIVAYTNLRLNTGVGAAQRISVGVWVKAAPNFSLRYIVPLSVNDNMPSLIQPPVIDYLFDFSSNRSFWNASQPVPPATIVFEASAVKTLNNGVYNTFTLEGVANSKHDGGSWQKPERRMDSGTIVKDSKVYIKSPTPQWLCSFKKGVAASFNPTQVFATEAIKLETDWTYTITDPGVEILETTFTIFCDEPYAHTVPPTDNEWSPPIEGESLVFFGNAQSDLLSAQHAEQSMVFASKQLSSWLPPGFAARFRIIDTANELPLGYVKLYKKGYFTTRAMSDRMILMFDKIKFEFDAFMLETALIPQKGDDARNFLMVSMHHARALKRLRKASLSRRSHARNSTLKIENGSSSSSSDRRKPPPIRSDPWSISRSSSDSEEYSRGFAE